MSMFFSSKPKKSPRRGPEDEDSKRPSRLFSSTTDDDPSATDDIEGVGLSLTESTEGEEAEEVVEQPEDDKKPFDATTSLLVFHDGQVYVREDRDVVVAGGSAAITDLPTTIDPASIHFRSLTDADASIIEHTLDNVNSDSCLSLADRVGEIVTLRQKDGGVVKGKLLRTSGKDDVLELEDGSMVMVSRLNVVGVEFDSKSFVREPTLHCVIETEHEGLHKSLLTYEASGIQWSAEYTLVVRPDAHAELNGWITLGNESGKTFKDAALALVTAPRLETISRQDSGTSKMKKPFSALSSFSKQRVHKPTVATKDTTYMPRPITLVQGKAKQVRITHASFPVEQINLFRKFSTPYKGSYQGSQSDSSMEGSSYVEEVLRWTNSKATHHRLGIELAGGSLTVLDSVKGDTYLHVLHQTTLNFTHPGEDIVLITGQKQDLVGERKVTELRSDARMRTVRETVQIEIKNRGNKKYDVVVEDLLWRWRSYVVHPCQPKYDDLSKPKQVMTWRLTLAPKSVETIRYSVLYSKVPVP